MIGAYVTSRSGISSPDELLLLALVLDDDELSKNVYANYRNSGIMLMKTLFQH